MGPGKSPASNGTSCAAEPWLASPWGLWALGLDSFSKGFQYYLPLFSMSDCPSYTVT